MGRGEGGRSNAKTRGRCGRGSKCVLWRGLGEKRVFLAEWVRCVGLEIHRGGTHVCGSDHIRNRMDSLQKKRLSLQNDRQHRANVGEKPLVRGRHLRKVQVHSPPTLRETFLPHPNERNERIRRPSSVGLASEPCNKPVNDRDHGARTPPHPPTRAFVQRPACATPRAKRRTLLLQWAS